MNDFTSSRTDVHPSVGAVVARLREVFGEETSVGPNTVRWWVDGAAQDMGVAIRMDTSPPEPGEPCVLWVTRPGEAAPERCPIIDMPHLDAFLGLVSIARRSTAPVHGNVCPGED